MDKGSILRGCGVFKVVSAAVVFGASCNVDVVVEVVRCLRYRWIRV